MSFFPRNWLDRVADTWRAYALLSLVAVVFYLPGITSLPPTDRDEARFAQASRQMLETGNFVEIFFQDKPRHKKPAGAYWLQAASTVLFSDVDSKEIWSYRIPSFFSMWAAVISFFWLSARLVPRAQALAASLVLATCAVVTVEAHLAKADAALLLTVVLSQGILGWAFVDREWWHRQRSIYWPLLFWAALGVGVLVKGPVLPGLVGLTVISLSLYRKSWQWLLRLRPVSGLALVALMVLPWFLAIESQSETSFTAQAWQEDILPKLVGVHESHWGPPGYYAVLGFATFWPWSFFAVPALVQLWKSRASDVSVFCLAWLVPAWLLLEVVPTKLPHYSMPLFPALAFVVARFLYTDRIWVYDRLRVVRISRWLWFLFSGLLAFGPLVLAYLLDGGIWAWAWATLGALLGFRLIGTVIGEDFDRTASRKPLGLLLLAFLAPITIALFLPALDSLWISERLNDALVRVEQQLGRSPQIIVTGLREPSLVFRAGTDIRLVEEDLAPELYLKECPVIAVVRDRHLDDFRKIVEPALGHDLKPLEQVRAFNYSNTKWMSFDLFVNDRCLDG